MTQIMEKKSFMLYGDLGELFGLLDMTERGRLITAIFNFVNAGEPGIELSAPALMAFCTIRRTLERDHAAYLAKCEKNAENGRKGGRPRGKAVDKYEPFFNEKTERLFLKPKKADNDSDNVNVNDNVIDNDSVSDNDTDTDIDSVNDNESAEADVLSVCDGTQSLSEAEEKKEEEIFEEREDGSAVAPAEKEEAEKGLSAEEELRLELMGVPKEYAEKRLKRARFYAEKQKKPVGDVLSEWWQEDTVHMPPPAKGKNGVEKPISLPEGMPEEYQPTFDLDDFFNAALEKSMRMKSGE